MSQAAVPVVTAEPVAYSSPSSIVTPAVSKPSVNGSQRRVKINALGEFQPFPGVTVISNVAEKQKEVWSRLYQQMSEIPHLRSHYALLPPSSYHLTTMNLFTEAEHRGGEEWSEMISHQLPFFQRIDATLKSHPLIPHATLDRIMVSSVIMIWVRLTPEQEAQIHRVAQELNFNSGVPTRFHVTLAYQYQPLTSELARSIQSELQRLVDETLKTHIDSLEFDAPQLSYFPDMTVFHPWNGEFNPFLH